MYIEEVKHKIPKKIEPQVVWYSDIKPEMFKINKLDFDIDKAFKLVDVSCGFDTEFYTLAKYTNKNDDNEDDVKIVSANAYIYLWQFSFNSYVILGRHITEFIELLSIIAKVNNLGKKRKIRIWVANLGCEFQFIRKYLDVKKLFGKKKREPMYFETNEFMFQDCLCFSGGGLEDLAKTYTSTKKLVGDLDYNIPRNSKTPLTEKEIQYAVNDVVILAEFNQYITETYLKQGFNPPMTKTGLLRFSVQQRFIDSVIELDEYNEICGINTKAIDTLIERFPEKDDYNILTQYVFRGGYVHSNILNTGVVLEHVYGIDYTSSYPAVMLQCKYPITKFQKYNGTVNDKFLSNKAWYARFEFTNLRNLTPHSIESVCKVVGYDDMSESELIKAYGITLDNGRIQLANKLVVYLTDLDYKTYLKFYTWDSMVVTEIQYSQYGSLPDYLLDPLKYYYRIKSELKNKGLDETTEYIIAKAMVNAGYGMCVEKYQTEQAGYKDGEWITTSPPDYRKRLGIDFRTLRSQGIPKVLLLPQWGIWISAHARHRLLSMVHKINYDVIYCDTDSIYMLNYEEHKTEIEEYNKSILAYNEKHFDNLLSDIGTFDPVNKKHLFYDKFKTLGAKRYIKYDSKEEPKKQINVTIAGLPKASLPKYCAKHGFDIFEYFDDEMFVSMEFSSKNAHKYNDKEHGDWIIDQYGNKEFMISESSMGIYKCVFTLQLAEYYEDMIEMVKQKKRQRI